MPLQIEHIHPKSKGGSNRASNLTLACRCCNEKKAALPIEVFLAKKPEVLKRILTQAKRPLRDAAAVNTTRWALLNALKTTGLPVDEAPTLPELMSEGRPHLVRRCSIDDPGANCNCQRMRSIAGTKFFHGVLEVKRHSRFGQTHDAADLP